MGASDRFLKLTAADPQLAVAAASWSALIESLPDAAWLVDAQTNLVVAANTAAHVLLGSEPGALVGEPAESLLMTPEDLAYWSEALSGNPGPHQSEATIYCERGSNMGRNRRVRRTIQPFVHGESGQALIMVVLNDLTERYETQDRLEQAMSELQATLESTADGILVTDLNGGIRAFNRRFSDLWSLPQTLLQQRDDPAVHAWLRAQVEDQEAYDSRLRELVNSARLSTVDKLKLRSGVLLERCANPLLHGGQSLGRVYSFRDLSEREAAQQRITELSQTDPLTGLWNRVELAAVVARAAQQSARGAGGFALMLVDLDRFSALNESLGASGADLVLLEVAKRLRHSLREGDLAARIAGDQFALLIHDADVPSAETTARRVLDAISATTQIGNLSFTLTCSIGVAVSPLHGRGLDELLANADAAMRRAKEAGRATWRMHTLRRAADPRVTIRMDHAMRQALAQERFRVCYQPQVDIATGAVVGAEALLRWFDPDFGGEVSPARFIPVAEDSGLIIALGDWVLRQTLRQAALWREAGLSIPVAVNVSALQFHQPGFAEQVACDLRHCKLPAQLLELEVTESLLLRDADDTLARLKALAALGVRLSIDDFGTGYSNMAYLKRLPLTQLKIDRSFIKDLPGDKQDAGIVTAILQLARALGIEAIAEGVETLEQHQFLKKAGCERFQGFLFAPALDPARFVARWRSSRPGRTA
jgi:diguanylate cyclase (GGDEF)-like protein/PAS domain S-box-containing protein